MIVLAVADLHLRSDRPACRTDENWIESQRKDLEFIGKVAKENNCQEIWLLGDIFHHPVEPPEVVNMAINEFNSWKQVVSSVKAICGNHDLQYHSLANFNKASISTLFHSGILERFDNEVDAFDFNQEKPSESDIVITHQLVFPDERLKSIAGGKCPSDIRLEFPNARAILMGDYHDGWNTEYQGQIQIMVGCMNIQSGKLADYKPHVCIFNTFDYSHKFVDMPDNSESITTEHLMLAKERDERLERCAEIASKSAVNEFDFPNKVKECAYNLGVEDMAIKMLTELGEA